MVTQVCYNKEGWNRTPTLVDRVGENPTQKEYRDTTTSVQERGRECACSGVVERGGVLALHLLICTICPLLLQHTLATSDRCLPSIWWFLTHIKRDTGKRGRFTFPKQGDQTSSGLIRTTEETACGNGRTRESHRGLKEQKKRRWEKQENAKGMIQRGTTC